ncbi:RNA binding protein, heterogenous nuclear RNP-K like protein [Coemansia sp. RSA 2618]|nr:RNA binding protein, heterogenous nuclear RNP-K like protein [Coemansia sp. RSA 2618]
MRCVFPYEDGGIIIGLRGAHLSKLRHAVQEVDWRISNETSDRQDRILVVKGSVADVAKHFLSQGMYVDYPLQTRGRGSKEVDVSQPFIPIRLLMPHKTCGAIIGQKSETLINTRINCEARRVYVYRERIADSRERVVEVVGTPKSIARVMEVLGEQVARTLTNDQAESDLYIPERDGLRKFLSKQGVPRSRVSLETIKSANSDKAAKTSADTSNTSLSRKGGERKRSRSRSRSRDADRSRRSGRQHHRHPESRSPSRTRNGRGSKRRKGQGAGRDDSLERGSSGKKSRAHDKSNHGESDGEDHPMDTSPDSKKTTEGGMVATSTTRNTEWGHPGVSATSSTAVEPNSISGGSW